MKRKIVRVSPGLIKIEKVYYSDIRIRNGKDPSTGRTLYKRLQRALSTDRRIADEELSKLIKQRNAIKHGHAPTDSSWSSLKKRFFRIYASKSKITRRHYVRALRVLEATFPITDIKQVTPDLLVNLYLRWKNGHGEQEPRPLYVRNRDMECLLTFMRRVERWGAVQAQDWEPVLGVMDKEPRGRVEFFTPAEVGILKGKTYNMWRTMTMLGARAGLRPGEMFTLEKSDIDWQQEKIHIQSKPKQNWFVKTYEIRSIPMPKDLKDYLWQVSQEVSGGFVVANPDGGRASGTDSMSQYFSRRVRAAGLKGHLYKLRHSYASHLVQAGVPLQIVRDLMGHRSVVTTECYAHLIPKMHFEAVEKLPEIEHATSPSVDDKVDDGSSKKGWVKPPLDGDGLSRRIPA